MQKVLVCGSCNQDTIFGKNYYGGAGGGIAINLSSLGIPVGLLSVLGNDNFSQNYLKKLQDQKIDIELISFSENPISQVVVSTRENSETARSFHDFGNHKLFRDLAPDPKTLNAYDLIHVVNTPKTLADYIAAHFKGQISYAPASLFYRDPKNYLSTKLLLKTSFLFLNENEYNLLENISDPQKLLQKNLKLLCKTLGRRGLTFKTKEASKDLPAANVNNGVDSTGAGDALVVGFIKSYLDQKPFDQSLVYGLKLAAKVVEKYGVLFKD